MTDVEMVSSSPSQKTKEEQDLYMRMKDLESELEILQIQEEYLKDEQRHLKSEYVRSKEEVSKMLDYSSCSIDQKNLVGVPWHW
jgi:26S proteasome regulatory subunit T3